MKLQNKSKGRNATPNELAKAFIISRLENVFYYRDDHHVDAMYTEEFHSEISRFLNKHIRSIEKKLNPNNDHIESY